MIALSTGQDEIVAENGVTIFSPDPSFTPDDATYTNQSVTYNQISFVTSDVYIQSYTQAFSIIESTNKTLIPNLSCSISGSTSIAYSLSSYNGAIFPLFVSIDYATGVLSIAAPSVSNSTDYSFYIISNITGVTSPVQNFIKLTVKKCTPSNWQLCSATDSSICTNCNTGYSLNSGSCSLKESETAKSLSSSGQAAVGASVGLWFVSSLLNAASLASLWSMINQTQIFFFLLITGAFIPKDIETVITGLKISLNPFAYFQSNSGGNSNFVSTFFDFGLENSNLEKLGIKSDSTAVNIYSFILSMLIISALHLWIAILQRFLKKTSKSDCWEYVLTIIHSILKKLMVLFTFALYIRIMLKTNQYILVSWISEIYHFNTSDTKRIISLVIAFITLLAWIIMIITVILFVFIQNEDSNEESPDKRSKFAHLFNGISPNKKSRLFIAILQIRRAIFVTLLITVGPVSSILVISILSGLQVIYLTILIVIRPFELAKCNLIEIVNEMYFFTLLASLLRFNSIADWEGTPTTIYTWFISSNSISGFTIIISKFNVMFC